MVDEGDAAGQRRKVKRLFNGTVAAADDGDVTTGELCAVAFRAGAHSAAEELTFARHVEGPARGTHGENDCAAVVLGITRVHRLERAAEIESVDVAGVELGAELLSLSPHCGRQHGTRDERRDTGVVVYPPGG
ncbi:hypothetical protein A5738_09040 [Mycobacterium colombiense]|nr:hypothetical protein A5738_09040 [Mycobacterium colombiense]